MTTFLSHRLVSRVRRRIPTPRVCSHESSGKLLSLCGASRRHHHHGSKFHGISLQQHQQPQNRSLRLSSGALLSPSSRGSAAHHQERHHYLHPMLSSRLSNATQQVRQNSSNSNASPTTHQSKNSPSHNYSNSSSASQSPTRHPSTSIVELTKRLLSNLSSSHDHPTTTNNYPLRHFEQTLATTRTNNQILHKLQLAPEQAASMFLLPPDLLRDVHSAIMHFSRKENHRGVVRNDDATVNDGGGVARRRESVPGPIVCAQLLQLIGIPHYHQHVSLSSLPSTNSSTSSTTTMQVHSSQIDPILECALETTVALSRSCEAGKVSLIGSDFNMQNSVMMQGRGGGEKKTAAQLCEEILRSVWNLEILYTSGLRDSREAHSSSSSSMQYHQHHLVPQQQQQQIRIGRIGSIGCMVGGNNPMMDYLSAARHDDGRGNKTREQSYGDYNDNEPSQQAVQPWSPRDQRRYDKSLVLFNSVLAAYAKLSASASGVRQEVRRDMVQNAELLLLEVANKNDQIDGAHYDNNGQPIPSTMLQCLQPDVISFNTTMKALSEWAPRQKWKHEQGYDENAHSVGTATAERTESILGVMQDLSDDERTGRTTLQSMQAAWKGQNGLHGGDNGGSGKQRAAIAPDTSSYNIALKAWSRSSNPNDALRGLKLYQTMLDRGNVACAARDSLIRQHSSSPEQHPPSDRPRKGRGKAGDVAFPDSRTAVVLLQSLQNLSRSVGFRDAVDTVESIFTSMKQRDELIQWSAAERGGAPERILNVFSYNTLIKTLSKLPTNSLREHHECCSRIDDVIEEMKGSASSNAVMQCLPTAIMAWTKCAGQAGKNRAKVRMCAEKVGAHIDALMSSVQPKDGGNDSYSTTNMIRAINNSIALYGKAGMPSKADELFNNAKECNMHNLETLSTTIDALCQNGLEDIADVEKAKWYLFGYEQDKMSMAPMAVAPDMKYTSMYNSVISGYLNCDTKTIGREEAQALLAHMVSSHESNPRHIARPNTTSFARVMSALSHRGDNRKRLEELLSKMEALHQRRNSVPRNSPDAELVANVAPNTVIFNFLLKSYARSNDNDAVQSGMKLLARMESSPDVKPDEISNSYIMALLSRNDNDTNAKVVTTPISENDKLVNPPTLTSIDDLNIDDLNLNLDDLNFNGQRSMPTSKSFKALMNVYATTGTVEGAEKGAVLIQKLEEMHSSGEIGFKPDIFLYNSQMNSWSLCERDNNDESISPARNAQKILDFICDKYEGGDATLTPNDVSFSVCIHAWAKSNLLDASKHAERQLRRKEEYAEKKCSNVEIKYTDYNCIIAKCKEDDPTKAPERATELFEEMLQKYGGHPQQTRPNASTLNALLDVYAKCYQRNMAEQAQGYLNRMNQLHEEGNGHILPDVISYRTVMDAWVRQWHRDSPQKVFGLVKEMTEKYKQEGRTDLRPDSNSLNLILKACSHAPAMWEETKSSEKGEDNPISIANRVFSMLKGDNEYGATATHATYSFMFNLYRQHMNFRDKRYPPLMKTLWKHCCRDGLVSQLVLNSFRSAVQDHDFFDVLGGEERFERLGKTKDDIGIKDLPEEWSRNVTDRIKPKRSNSITRN